MLATRLHLDLNQTSTTHSNKLTFFYSTPKPFFDEAFSSWIQRSCAMHGISLYWFRKYINLSHSKDLDSELICEDYKKMFAVLPYASHWEHLISIAEIDDDFIQKARHENNSNLLARLKRRKINGRNNKFMWCPSCLEEDIVPYFRRYWRNSRICLIHRIDLRAACQACQSELDLNKTFLGLNLGHCQSCGTNLWSGIKAFPPKKWSSNPSSTIAHQEKYKRRQQEITSLKFTTNDDLWTLRGVAKRPPLHITSATFLQAQPAPIGRSNWSKRAPRGSRSRIALAAALWLIRREQRGRQ